MWDWESYNKNKRIWKSSNNIYLWLDANSTNLAQQMHIQVQDHSQETTNSAIKHWICSDPEKNTKTKKTDQNPQRKSAAMKKAESVYISSHSLSSNLSYDKFPIQMLRWSTALYASTMPVGASNSCLIVPSSKTFNGRKQSACSVRPTLKKMNKHKINSKICNRIFKIKLFSCILPSGTFECLMRSFS